jgi:hypothetical protein
MMRWGSLELIVDIDVARHVIRIAFRASGELQSLFSLLKAHCNPDEYESFAKAIATAIASINLEVMDRAIATHPDLESEIEASIAKHERYL